ncbi:MAG: HNH endonuclease [Solirubrobacterales bacterium]
MRADRGTPVIFKLKMPQNAICGFGFFSQYQRIPVWQAWELFGAANGVSSQAALTERIKRIASRNAIDIGPDPHVGCVVLAQPCFLPPDEWIEIPDDWKSNIVTGRSQNLATGEGQRIWAQCLAAYARLYDDSDEIVLAAEAARRGTPRMIAPRLGQASFRLDVQSAYSDRCAVTGEHSLPVLEAAHVTPWGAGGPHSVSNGILLRSDLHRLFDRGYVTVSDGAQLVVGEALREEWNNGKAYYELQGRTLFEPETPRDRIDRDRLAWHRESVFLG